MSVHSFSDYASEVSWGSGCIDVIYRCKYSAMCDIDGSIWVDSIEVVASKFVNQLDVWECGEEMKLTLGEAVCKHLGNDYLVDRCRDDFRRKGGDDGPL